LTDDPRHPSAGDTLADDPLHPPAPAAGETPLWRAAPAVSPRRALLPLATGALLMLFPIAGLLASTAFRTAPWLAVAGGGVALVAGTVRRQERTLLAGVPGAALIAVLALDAPLRDALWSPLRWLLFCGVMILHALTTAAWVHPWAPSRGGMTVEPQAQLPATLHLLLRVQAWAPLAIFLLPQAMLHLASADADPATQIFRALLLFFVQALVVYFSWMLDAQRSLPAPLPATVSLRARARTLGRALALAAAGLACLWLGALRLWYG
jgi:hypothetical protein